MKIGKLLFFLLAVFIKSQAQISITSTDTTDQDIKSALHFYTNYIREFSWQQVPDYSKYWSANDCKRYKVPDHTVYSVSSDQATYLFSEQKTIYYTHKYPDYVHIKTLLTQMDSLRKITVLAITNHYVALRDSTGKIHFISPLIINSKQFRTIVNRNITYHFPVDHTFNKQKSDSLLSKLKKIEKTWGFQAINLDYYFADTKDKVAMMRGLDYYLAMEESVPTGMTFDYDKIIFSDGHGEDYLHEILHIYFNPVYVKSPVNHGLIYYLAGSLGHDFNWMIHRMNEYLVKYPETDLSQFETLRTNDRMLHIDYTVIGLICRMVDEKEGVTGLKRLLTYSTADELFEKEFHLQKKDWNSFLKQNFKKYDG